MCVGEGGLYSGFAWKGTNSDPFPQFMAGEKGDKNEQREVESTKALSEHRAVRVNMYHSQLTFPCCDKIPMQGCSPWAWVSHKQHSQASKSMSSVLATLLCCPW